MAESLNNQALLLRARGDLEAAEDGARRVLAIRRRLLGDAHPDTVQALDNVGVILASRGDYPAAEPLMREAVAGYRESLGEDHPDLAISLSNSAGSCARAEPRRALTLVRDATRSAARAFSEAAGDGARGDSCASA